MTPYIYSQSLESTYRKFVRDDCMVVDCKLNLEGFPKEKVILDIESIMTSDRRCDFAIIVDEGGSAFLLPVEFKSSNLNFNLIKQQIESSIRFLKTHLPAQFQCHPIIVSKKIEAHVRKRLPQIRIKYNGGTKGIKHVLCNQELHWGDIKKKKKKT